MTFIILTTVDGVETARIAKVATDALVVAEGAEQDGGADVQVISPDGQQLPLRVFRALVRNSIFGDRGC